MEWTLFADLADRAGDERVTVDLEESATVGDALEALLADREALSDRVLDEDGQLRPEVTVLRNGRSVRTLEAGLETPISADDELALLPPISGG